MKRGCFILARSLVHRLPRCYYLSVPRDKCPFWVVPMCTAIQHRKYCSRIVLNVVYDPKPDMSEEEVKHMKLDPVPETVDLPVKKYALLLSFNGQGYYGMQRNMTGDSVEDHLLKAMLDANLITQEQFLVPQLFSYQRTSRTDKGVSAARMLVSGTFCCDKSEIKMKLNQHLDNQIQVMAVFKTIQKFNCKTWCDSRTYSYTCPTFAFASYLEVIIQDSYRLSKDALEEVRRLFAVYKGVHNFHNFTSGIKPWERRAMRHILDIDCSEPFEQNGLEWITIRIKGLSFLLHQIRKMIGLVMAVRQGLASINFIPQALSEDYTYLPIAPGLGLVLEDQHFDTYNRKHASGKGTHEMLNWDSEAKVIEEYRLKNIITPIMDTELRERSMFKWLTRLHCYSFDMIMESEKDRKNKWLSKSNPTLVLMAQHSQHQKTLGGSVADVITPAFHLDEDPESVEITT